MGEQPKVVYVQNKNFLSTMVAMFVAILVSVPLAVMVASSVISRASAQSVDPQTQTSENSHAHYVYPPCMNDFGTSNNVEQSANPQINQGGAGGYHEDDEHHHSHHNSNGGSGSNGKKYHHASSVTNNATNNINQTTNNTTTNTITGSYNNHSYNGNEHSFNQDSYNKEMNISKTKNIHSFNTLNHTESDIEVENETHNNYEGIVGSTITTSNDQKNRVDSTVENTAGASVPVAAN
jgi:hypothetical protein